MLTFEVSVWIELSPLTGDSVATSLVGLEWVQQATECWQNGPVNTFLMLLVSLLVIYTELGISTWYIPVLGHCVYGWILHFKKVRKRSLPSKRDIELLVGRLEQLQVAIAFLGHFWDANTRKARFVRRRDLKNIICLLKRLQRDFPSNNILINPCSLEQKLLCTLSNQNEVKHLKPTVSHKISFNISLLPGFWQPLWP